MTRYQPRNQAHLRVGKTLQQAMQSVFGNAEFQRQSTLAASHDSKRVGIQPNGADPKTLSGLEGDTSSFQFGLQSRTAFQVQSGLHGLAQAIPVYSKREASPGALETDAAIACRFAVERERLTEADT